jgi:hypothetical protein
MRLSSSLAILASASITYLRSTVSAAALDASPSLPTDSPYAIGTIIPTDPLRSLSILPSIQTIANTATKTTTTDDTTTTKHPNTRYTVISSNIILAPGDPIMSVPTAIVFDTSIPNRTTLGGDANLFATAHGTTTALLGTTVPLVHNGATKAIRIKLSGIILSIAVAALI